MRWTTTATSLAATAVAVNTLLVAFPAPAAATNWALGAKSPSSAETESAGLPAAPSAVTATCVSATSDKVSVSWGATLNASSYSVYEATSVSGPYALVASGSATTSWTSPSLATGNYWFEASALVGINWQGPNSPASVESTVTKSGRSRSCTQP